MEANWWDKGESSCCNLGITREDREGVSGLVDVVDLGCVSVVRAAVSVDVVGPSTRAYSSLVQ